MVETAAPPAVLDERASDVPLVVRRRHLSVQPLRGEAMSPLDKLALWLAKAGLRITPWNLKCALDSIGITAGFMEEVAVIRSLESRGYLERIRIGLSDADCFPCILTAKGEEAAREIPDDPCHLIREIRESALVRA